MSSNATSMNRRRKQRVDVACDFCRKRKLGCDNAKPKCENCYAYQKECTYAVRTRKERPNNSSTNALQEEVIRLSKVVGELQSALDIQQAKSQAGTKQDSPALSTATRARGADLPPQSLQCQSTSLPIGANVSTKWQSPQFHGPTSAIFDGEHPSRRGATGINVAEDPSQKNQLLAEATKQRQMELINIRSGKLNFAGVDPETGMRLLAVFWNRQHATGSIVYRPSFMRDMASQGPYFSELLLNAIYFISSKHISSGAGSCDITGAGDIGTPFRRNMEAMLYHPSNQLLAKSSITTIQALLLFSDALFSWCDEKSLSWHYLGIATTMIIDLGIHSESSRFAIAKSGSPKDVEIQRRLFWAAFVLDKIQSIYQGRPARLRDMDNSVSITFLDEYEELEAFDSIGYSTTPTGMGHPTYGVSTFQHLCKLSTIADSILSNLYAEKSTERDPQELFRTSQSLHIDLKTWYKSLPAHLLVASDNSGCHDASNMNVVLPHIICLTLMFHSLLILLHRPFVSEGHLKSAVEMSSEDAFSICETAASDIDVLLRQYKSQWCIKSPPYFLSYATYVSATIHARVAAQKRQGSHAHLCLLNCLEILSEHQNVCHAPRRSMGILLGLMERLNVDVGRRFTAYTSRTAGSEVTAVEESKAQSSKNTLDIIFARERPLSESNNMRDPGTSAGHGPLMPAEATLGIGQGVVTHANGNQAGPVTGYDFGDQIQDMYFDIDPLFGFDVFQTDISADLSIG